MSITIDKIAYICIDDLEELADSLSSFNIDYVKKIESETGEEVWVEYLEDIASRIASAGFLTNAEWSELKAAKVDQILFYS